VEVRVLRRGTMDNLRRDKLEKLLASKFKKIKLVGWGRRWGNPKIFSWDDLNKEEQSLLIEEFSLFVDYADWDTSVPIVKSYYDHVRMYLWSEHSFKEYIEALCLVLRGDKIVDGQTPFPSSSPSHVRSVAQALWVYLAELGVPIEEKADEIHNA
jgi:hypothetical protein